MCSCAPYLLSTAALDSGQLLGRMLRSFVDLVTAPTVDAVAVPLSASVQAPPPSMNVEVNVSAVNPEPGTSWWHAHDDQGWWSWGKPVLKLFHMMAQVLIPIGSLSPPIMVRGRAMDTITVQNLWKISGPPAVVILKDGRLTTSSGSLPPLWKTLFLLVTEYLLNRRRSPHSPFHAGITI